MPPVTQDVSLSAASSCYFAATVSDDNYFVKSGCDWTCGCWILHRYFLVIVATTALMVALTIALALVLDPDATISEQQVFNLIFS